MTDRTGMPECASLNRRNIVQLKIKSQEDFWAGLMFIGFGVLAIVISRDYPMGSAMRMGPGYFPTSLGAIMVLLGSIITLLSFKVAGGKVKPFRALRSGRG